MKSKDALTKLGMVSVWAYGFGCAVGWGAFMMPQNIFLPEAGPLGSIIGIIISAVFLFFIAKATGYMAKTYPDEAGMHVYISRILGSDHGFLSAWAVLLAYVSIMWANSTAVVLLIRSVFGDVLQFGFSYHILDYDVYMGEILVTILVLLIFGVLAIIGKVAIRIVHIILALLHIGLIAAIFIAVLIGGHHSTSFGFSPSSEPVTLQVFNIMMLAPWMYVGFEAFMYMFNSGGRTIKHIDGIVIISIITIVLAYVLPILIPVLGLPDGYSDWQAYIADSSNAEGLLSIPVFYSTYYLLGEGGLYLLVACILSAISTSMFGLYRSSSRILESMAREELLPVVFARKNKNGEPYMGILLIMLVSCIIPFLGRTAVGWIVDVTTLTATIVYIYSMMAAIKLASSSKGIKVISILGMVFAIASFLYLLLPDIFSDNKLASESYLILAIWSLAGVIYYWYVYRKDKTGSFGNSPIMWIMMAFIIMFSTIMWLRQKVIDDLDTGDIDIERLKQNIAGQSWVLLAAVIIVLIALYSLFSILLMRQKEADKKALESESRSEAKTAFLFNMSHDIRTPMNAILGFTDLAMLDPANEDKMRDYLGKIKSSGSHLLSLINDILEMSRIESGKTDVNPKPDDLEQIFSNIESIMRGQAEAKGQKFNVDVSGISHRYIYVDRLRVNQVIINLVSNAIKYTGEGGQVDVIVTETDYRDNKITYNIRVRDNGFGMSEEFAAKIFDSFEREDKEETRGIQGTGLGMAITKSVIDILGGEIDLTTKEGVGSTFDVRLTFDEASSEEIYELTHKSAADESDFTGRRALLTDDMEINREIAVAILELYGFEVEQAVDGKDALTKVVTHPSGYYDIIFMDIQMPGLNGYEASMAIRNISDKKKASVPIIAMTANAFESDVKDALSAGMNGHVAKPIDQNKLLEEINKVFGD